LSESYKIFETNQFQKDIDTLNRRVQEKLYNKLVDYVYPQLKISPYYGKNIKKLKDWKPETWRYKIGNYRLFYEIDEKEKIIFILTLELRKNAY
jgi:mRNA interferase RelE/StbE